MKKTILSILILSFVFGIALISGCTGTSTPPTTPPPVQPTIQICSEVYVVSNAGNVFGQVFVNGIGVGGLLLPFGAVLASQPQLRCGDIVTVYIIRPDGRVSITKAATAVSPRTVVTFQAGDI